MFLKTSLRARLALASSSEQLSLPHFILPPHFGNLRSRPRTPHNRSTVLLASWRAGRGPLLAFDSRVAGCWPRPRPLLSSRCGAPSPCWSFRVACCRHLDLKLSRNWGKGSQHSGELGYGNWGVGVMFPRHARPSLEKTVFLKIRGCIVAFPPGTLKLHGRASLASQGPLKMRPGKCHASLKKYKLDKSGS